MIRLFDLSTSLHKRIFSYSGIPRMSRVNRYFYHLEKEIDEERLSLYKKRYPHKKTPYNEDYDVTIFVIHKGLSTTMNYLMYRIIGMKVSDRTILSHLEEVKEFNDNNHILTSIASGAISVDRYDLYNTLSTMGILDMDSIYRQSMYYCSSETIHWMIDNDIISLDVAGVFASIYDRQDIFEYCIDTIEYPSLLYKNCAGKGSMDIHNLIYSKAEVVDTFIHEYIDLQAKVSVYKDIQILHITSDRQFILVDGAHRVNIHEDIIPILIHNLPTKMVGLFMYNMNSIGYIDTVIMMQEVDLPTHTTYLCVDRQDDIITIIEDREEYYHVRRHYKMIVIDPMYCPYLRSISYPCLDYDKRIESLVRRLPYERYHDIDIITLV